MPAKPEAKELHGFLTVNVPITLLERLQPFARQRTQSKFVSAAVKAALDQYDAEQADQDHARAAAV
jgi:hypothetical protein